MKKSHSGQSLGKRREAENYVAAPFLMGSHSVPVLRSASRAPRHTPVRLLPGGGRGSHVPDLPATLGQSTGHALRSHILCPMPPQLPSHPASVSHRPQGLVPQGVPAVQHLGAKVSWESPFSGC